MTKKINFLICDTETNFKSYSRFFSRGRKINTKIPILRKYNKYGKREFSLNIASNSYVSAFHIQEHICNLMTMLKHMRTHHPS